MTVLHQQCPSPLRAQNSANCSSHRPQKTCTNPSFRCFSPYLAHTSAVRNFSIPTSAGRNFAVKWPISWPKVGVIRVNCHNLWKPFVAISASTMFGPFRRDSIAATRPPKKSPKMPRYRTAAPRACICRLPEPTRAHSRDRHVQTREAAKPINVSRSACFFGFCLLKILAD